MTGFYLIEAALRLYPPMAVYAGLAMVRQAFVGLLLAAVLTDRRKEVARG